MGLLVGVVAESVTAFASPNFALAPSLSNVDHWGTAVYDRKSREWSGERCTATARSDIRKAPASRWQGTLMLSHVHARGDAVDRITESPIRRESWLFAHEGPIDETDYIRRALSPKRYRGARDTSRGELLFMYLLTHLDGAGEGGSDAAIRDAVGRFVDHRVGAPTFLLTNGTLLYAYRGGRPLHILAQRPAKGEVVVASEPLADGRWRPLDNGTLLRCGSAVDPCELVYFAGRPNQHGGGGI
jgi:predicted glutamine amidotransferase